MRNFCEAGVVLEASGNARAAEKPALRCSRALSQVIGDKERGRPRVNCARAACLSASSFERQAMTSALFGFRKIPIVPCDRRQRLLTKSQPDILLGTHVMRAPRRFTTSRKGCSAGRVQAGASEVPLSLTASRRTPGDAVLQVGSRDAFCGRAVARAGQAGWR